MTPKQQRRRQEVIAEYKKRMEASGTKPALNLVVVGHVDAGKSTLMGHLLFLLGEVSDRTIQRFQRDAAKMGKGSFAYAWVLDETGKTFVPKPLCCILPPQYTLLRALTLSRFPLICP
jgi:hypothetical protein